MLSFDITSGAMDPPLSDLQFWQSVMGQFAIELIGGTVGALIFLFIVLLLFRPKVKIAPFICFDQPKGMDTVYYFKMVNLSYFSAYDLRIELFQVTKIPMSGGLFNNKYDPIPLVLNAISDVSARALPFRGLPYHPHCLVIRCAENLKAILKVETNAIALKISLKHGLTGLPRVIEREFGMVQDLRHGKFKPGSTFRVL